jgi:DNA mismatch repair protein MutS2
MIHTSGDVLEFEALRELLGRFVSSPLGRAELAGMAPSTDRSALESEFAEVAEAIEHVRSAARPQTAGRGAAIRVRFDSLPDVATASQKLRIEGAVLDAKEIYDLSVLLDRAAEARSLLHFAEPRFPRLSARAAGMADFRDVLRRIEGKVLPDGSVADHASVALNRLRRDIERQKRAIHESLERFLKVHREEGVLQEEFVAIRNERFVVPVIAGKQRRVEGVIHGASGTGRTLFVEPLETIDLNNELVRLTEDELREVHRILREFTALLREHESAIDRTLAIMAELEVLFARAEFAIEFGCVVPRFNHSSNPRLHLREARHPLLEDVLRRQKKPIVPISVTLEESRRTLLISGPNTGGKTVAMKTVGLLALMAQSGLPVPCSQAEFPLFDQLLADIGDNQSIQESLSTFSAHIACIRDILDRVTPESLVLLDELGRATDPEEGGALGVAILERLRHTGAFTLASTHLLALKIYGANTAGVVNGSMGFDEETLQPTYVLRLGAPGKSAGLDIASRLGMPSELIDRARAAMSSSERDIARFLGELHQRVESVSVLEKSLEEQRGALAARERALAKEWEQRESAKLRELEKRYEEAAGRFETSARETIDSIYKTAEQKKSAEQAMRRAAKTRREFHEEVQAAVAPKREGAPAPKAISEGDRVRLKNVREPAAVLRLMSDGIIEVQAGFMKMQVGLDEVVEVLPAAPSRSGLPKNVSFQAGPTWNVTYRELNVIGQRAEEACDQVDKFLDSAAMASIDRVRIVHGHGMGILKKAIADLLKTNPHVEKFYPAPQSEGGAGATIVELK